MRRWIAAAAAAALVACGGGGGSDSPDPAVAPSRTSLLFLGNSLTYYPTSATYNGDISQWGKGGWGMAASAPERDFVHIVSAAQGLPYAAMNLADNERDGAAALPAFTVDSGTVVVIQLGDNGLAARYGEIVQRARAGARLLCVSAWGPLAERDAAMRPQCEAGGGAWVDISDLRGVGAYVGPYGHPSDAGMAQIAARINAALR